MQHISNAFGHKQLTSVTIPDSVIDIGTAAFIHNSITSLTLGNSIQAIGPRAFEANQLTSVTIPDSVTTIEWRAFADNQLTSLIIPDSVTNIGDWAFANNQISLLTIGDSVTSIGGGAFYGNKITSLTIPDSVTSIGGMAFYENQLTSLDLGSDVQTIGGAAFYGNQLTSIAIPNTITSIGDSTFYGNRLTSLTLGNNVQTIGYDAFGYNQLTFVTIPNSVTNIEQNAFAAQGYFTDPDPDNETGFVGNYVQLYTEDPSNPNHLTDAITFGCNEYSEDTWECLQHESWGGHLINPAQITLSYRSGGTDIASSQTFAGPSAHTYATSDGPTLPAIADIYDITPEEQTAIDNAFAAHYFRRGQTVQLPAPTISGYQAPSPATQSFILTNPTNQGVFNYTQSGSTPETPPSSSFDLSTLAPLDQGSDHQSIANAVIAVSSSHCYTLDSSSIRTFSSSGITTPNDVNLLGGIGFTITCAQNGESSDATITLGTLIQDASKLRVYKKSSSSSQLEDITSRANIFNQAGRTVIVYTLVDGGDFDEDGTVNGVVVDPIYIGVIGASNSDDELAATGTSALTLAIGGGALLTIGATFVIIRRIRTGY